MPRDLLEHFEVLRLINSRNWRDLDQAPPRVFLRESRASGLTAVEVKRLAPAAVRADDAPHQSPDADRDAERFKPAG